MVARSVALVPSATSLADPPTCARTTLYVEIATDRNPRGELRGQIKT
jgi:hypothetical protein